MTPVKSTDMLNAKISGIASYVPDDILDNEMLSKMVDTNDEWITTRVGIKERRILKKDAGSSYMGIEAVKKLLAETGTAAEDVELLICATSNPDYRFPSTASVIAHNCKLTNCYAYDIQAACAGFIVALQDANAYIRGGLYKKVIVAELNTGQFADYLQARFPDVEIHRINKVEGQPFMVREITDAVKRIAAK